jgi:hypothetical protein
MFTVLAMPKIASVGPYHLVIYSSRGKKHGIYSFKLMQDITEIATYNLSTGNWQAIKNKKALDEVSGDIDYWLQLDEVQDALIQQCNNALEFKPIQPISIPIEKKALKMYLKNKKERT